MSQFSPREETLFSDALAQPSELRAAFLDRECAGEPELRARVDSLLAAHAETGGLLEPLILPPREPAVLEGKPGDRFGRYKLLTKIGEGGCGLVFMAEQEEPVRRRVALKVIKAGMDTREVIARFEAERQALALMDHPGICKVLDAGATESGRPYFVMELVRGVPITKYCDEARLSTTARLELFRQVCEAVQHAHQKGIIHRDLKPSNILVTLHGTTAMPKVIDFGIAKATQGRLTDSTLFTAYEQFIGTPAYMAPEQAEMTGLDVDTRTDVYSLGVLLYELLAGRTPFDPKSLLDLSRDELLRIIREVEPAKPSTHLATLTGEARGLVAQRRSTDPAKLRLLVAGDLDWIVMKALEKNRARRYDTPAALSEDIARHLRHEPVIARPPGKIYRAQKFVRRHRVGVSAIGGIVIVLVSGLVVSLAQAVRATRAEHVAQDERSRAVAARGRADDLLDFMLGGLRTEVKKVGKLDLLDLVGEKATTYFAQLAPHELDDPTLLKQTRLLRQIGEVQIEKARYAEAMKSLASALERADALVRRNPDNGDMLFERGQVEYYVGFLHWRKGELALANRWLTRYQDTARLLAPMDPGNLAWQREVVAGHHNLAVLDMDRGELAAARAAFLAETPMVEALLAAKPDDPDLLFRLADITSYLGTAAERAGDFAEAIRRYGDQTAQLEALLVRQPDNMPWRFGLADSMSRQVELRAVTGRIDEARLWLARALAAFDPVVKHDKANLRWQLGLLNARLKGVMLDGAEGKWAAAEETLREIHPQLEALSSTEPSDRNFTARLVTLWRLESELRRVSGRGDAAEAAERALHHAASLVANSKADDRMLGECAQAYVVAGRIAHGLGRPEMARRHWEQALHVMSVRMTDARNWRLLDPQVRALELLGRAVEGGPTVTLLHGLGYRPIEAWPEAIAAGLSVRSNQNKQGMPP